MDANVKKTTLRMIPYGIYVLTAEAADGRVAAATVNFVTQTSFNPPLVAVALKETKVFALNMLGKGQQGAAFAFFKPADKQGDKISGEAYRKGASGAPILLSAPASVECKVVEIVAKGDHHIVVGEVIEATLAKAPEGRPDQAILFMSDLGANVFYGG
jgi:flavin reductase (DIM6/NTAB) family NADH-FMN oxidoreductase RutF